MNEIYNVFVFFYYSVTAAERNWYSDDEDENQDQDFTDDVNDAHNLPASTVTTLQLYLTCLLTFLLTYALFQRSVALLSWH